MSQILLEQERSLYEKNGSGTRLFWCREGESDNGTRRSALFYARIANSHSHSSSAVALLTRDRCPDAGGPVIISWESPDKWAYRVRQKTDSGLTSFEELSLEKEALEKAVSSLNTVWQRRKADVHIAELPEDDCEED
ncbi:hypothetical protein B0H11DRAFT_1901200 [Mycena galericulata]|nr:hypothetical protein B0H11DRAFT_1901200 [Mycena galericulata]